MVPVGMEIATTLPAAEHTGGTKRVSKKKIKYSHPLQCFISNLVFSSRFQVLSNSAFISGLHLVYRTVNCTDFPKARAFIMSIQGSKLELVAYSLYTADLPMPRPIMIATFAADAAILALKTLQNSLDKSKIG